MLSTNQIKGYLKYNISGKGEGIKLIFCMQKSIKNSYKLILLVLMGVGRHAQSTRQNNNFPITLEYLQKQEKDEVEFLIEDKQSFLQVNTIIFVCCG